MKALSTAALVLAGTSCYSADEFSRWTWRNPTPLGTTLYAIVHAEDKFVAVGTSGSIVTSPDGREWTIEASGTVRRFLGVTYGDGTFVAYGFQAALAVSPDGHTWTLPAHNLPYGIKGMAFGVGAWVALDEYGNISSSTDLVEWSGRVSSVLSAFGDVIFAQDKFVAVGNRGVIMTSTNGIVWKPQDSGTLATFNDIAYGDGRFVAVGNSDESGTQGIILTSSNAEDWQIQFAEFPLYGVAYGPGGFTVVGGGFGGCGRSLTSPGGLYYEPGPDDCGSGLDATPYDVACNDEVCVAVGYGGTISISDDGLTWTGQQEGLAAATLHASAASDEFLVAVGGPSALLVSTDGRSFTNQAMPGIWRAVATDGTAFVAVGEDGVVVESADGTEWRFAVSPTTSDLYGVTHGSAGWLAGGGGTLLRKAPGENWNNIAAPGSATLRRLRFSQRLNCYVALGDQGTMSLSTTGLDWLARGPSTTEGLYDFAESSGCFAVVSPTRVFISVDTLSWTEVATGASQQTSILHGNGVFAVGAGQPKTLLVSTDGVAWHEYAVGAQYLTGLAYFKSSFYAVGTSGMILQSASASVPEFLSITPGGNTLNFELFGEIGRDYELQSSTNLTDWAWEQDYTQSARHHPLTLPTGSDQRFYRVKLKEP